MPSPQLNRTDQRREMDPFDLFGLYEREPLPYCWFGITPTLFDAPWRDGRTPLDWVAHSLLGASPESPGVLSRLAFLIPDSSE